MSFTHIATQSCPMVSCLSSKKANFSFVPTPSVPDTKIGSFISLISNLKRPPNPPRSDITPFVYVSCTLFFISSTALYPAVTSTPASL